MQVQASHCSFSVFLESRTASSIIINIEKHFIYCYGLCCTKSVSHKTLGLKGTLWNYLVQSYHFVAGGSKTHLTNRSQFSECTKYLLPPSVDKNLTTFTGTTQPLKWQLSCVLENSTYQSRCTYQRSCYSLV